MKLKNRVFSFWLVVSAFTVPSVSSAQQKAGGRCAAQDVYDADLEACVPAFFPPLADMGKIYQTPRGDVITEHRVTVNPHDLDMAMEKLARAYAQASGTSGSQKNAVASFKSELSAFSPIVQASVVKHVNKMSSSLLQRIAAVDLLSRTGGKSAGPIGTFARVMIEGDLSSLDLGVPDHNVKNSSTLPEDKDLAAKIGKALCSGDCPPAMRRTISIAVRADRLSHGGLQANVGPLSAEDLAAKTLVIDPAIAQYRRLASGQVDASSEEVGGEIHTSARQTATLAPASETTPATLAPPANATQTGPKNVEATVTPGKPN